MREKKWKELLTRHPANPIIAKDDIPFPCNTVFNAGATKINGQHILLLRVEGLDGRSVFCLARSTDGFNFEIEENPVMTPSSKEPFKTYEENGIEDPRITKIGDTYYIIYTATSKYGYRLAIASTKDFRTFERISIVSEPFNKDGALFPAKFGNHFARLDRPSSGSGEGQIWISFSEDLIHWGDSKVVMETRPGFWDAVRIGAGAQPIRTKEGWLEIYHGVKSTPSGVIYRLGCALFDINDPSRLIGRSVIPILAPQEIYERAGDVPNVIFTCGAVLEEEKGEIRIYYGAADTQICVGTGKIEDLLISCLAPSYLKCQVCGRHIVKEATPALFTYRNADYPLCGPECKKRIMEDPEFFIKS